MGSFGFHTQDIPFSYILYQWTG